MRDCYINAEECWFRIRAAAINDNEGRPRPYEQA
jgi:hypothetical protein